MTAEKITVEHIAEQEMLMALVGQFIADIHPLDEPTLRSRTAQLRPAVAASLSDEMVDHVVLKLMERHSVTMDLGVAITDSTFEHWLQRRRPDIEWTRWKAYKQYLIKQGIPLRIIERMDETTDEIVELAGDPSLDGGWKRRGLTIGDVQSGKTGTYLGILNKAADAGYKLIIVLAGNSEQLRTQTQERVDSGFIGRDSRMAPLQANQAQQTPRTIGVGAFDKNVTRTVGMTTMHHDFRKQNREAINFALNEMTAQPHIFVLKKNKTVLQGVARWLRAQAEGQTSLSIPLLLLDDESDYASVNTREEEDPTAINNAIRDLLALSERNSYLAFTATPFANIFIDHGNEDDLFPRDYIYALEAPTNYVGAERVFGPDNQDNVKLLDDAEEAFPLGHKESWQVSSLPESLRTAVRTFFIANAIRDRSISELAKARSMLVNVSRFVRVQNQVASHLTNYVAELKNAIEFHAASHAQGNTNTLLHELEDTYHALFPDIEYQWSTLILDLHDAVRSIKVRTYNAKSVATAEPTGSEPPRTIAVGGDVLSRGVTLDGLMTSYFYRRTAAADTLMQMARWFGYRDGYEDLCRLWIDQEVAGQFQYINESVEELRRDLKTMRTSNLTPKDFGLAVREHPDSLLITARNKMRSSSMEASSVNLYGRSIEAVQLSTDPQLRMNNELAATRLLETAIKLLPNPEEQETRRQNYVFRSIPKVHIADFLDAYRSYEGEPFFGSSELSRWVRTLSSAQLQLWDLVLVSGSGESISLAGLTPRAPSRTMREQVDGTVRISGERGKVASSTDVGANLLSAQIYEDRLEEFRRKNPEAKGAPESWFISKIDRPSLLLYPIRPAAKDGRPGVFESKDFFVTAKIVIPGESMSRINARDGKYRVNTVGQSLKFMDLNLEEDDDY